jgi:hypothetical protein
MELRSLALLCTKAFGSADLELRNLTLLWEEVGRKAGLRSRKEEC